MKPTTLFLLLTQLFLTCYCQNYAPVRGEFANQNNGLMYSDSIMRKLTCMVDSLNRRFASCDKKRQFFSCPQGRMFAVTLASTSNTLKDCEKDLKGNVDFITFLSRYKQYITELDTERTIIQVKGNGEDDYYLSGTPLEGYDKEWLVEARENGKNGRWSWYYHPKDQDQPEYEITAHYVPSALKSQKVPFQYGNYIQYVDCMVDTSAKIYLEGNQGRSWDRAKHPTIVRLTEYLQTRIPAKKPARSYYSYFQDDITNDGYSFAVAQLRGDDAFKKLVADAVDSSIANAEGTTNLERLAATFVSKQKSLEMMRRRSVWGRCSADPSPRLHARDIAVMAAETNSWDIFLRSHLDIMNDRFDRSSDGSYAYGERKTYLKELELLNLDIVDLVVGLSLTANNTAQNYYNGTIWRLGWALTERKDSIRFEQTVKRIMKDKQLDSYNRGILFLLYKTYVYALPDIGNTNRKLLSLKNDMASYPSFIQASIRKLKYKTTNQERERW